MTMTYDRSLSLSMQVCKCVAGILYCYVPSFRVLENSTPSAILSLSLSYSCVTVYMLWPPVTIQEPHPPVCQQCRHSHGYYESGRKRRDGHTLSESCLWRGRSSMGI